MTHRRTFATPAEWREQALARNSSINEEERIQRQQLADAHNREYGVRDADTLADQQLYIQGKMDIEEYQHYLLFKHSSAANHS